MKTSKNQVLTVMREREVEAPASSIASALDHQVFGFCNGRVDVSREEDVNGEPNIETAAE
jgi:hypothetical protein